ncbi:hypothetical protein [Legionella quateirensis]|uniref:Transmembrane protein n=1 Tax=Legionella quateirensis TaxID=45072 RepID=A0A378KPA3_9GAMM|nr:hypothetical protein [Legionella quateirensis]KTD52895.1 transmembrane protein [Legionella quateirensis]STY16375.1 transmembrane protein [Legionella quateirensis]
MNKNRKKISSIRLIGLLAMGLIFTSTHSFALPFNIVPKAGTELPRSFKNGQTVFAYYTVYNNTLVARSGNFVKYLPLNVTQVTGNGTYPDICGSSFNLNGKGQPGSSCTLQLRISGVVNKDDLDPHHQLFVCFPGGKTCAGTQSRLDVTQDLTAYIIGFNSNNITKCPIQSNGSFGTCSSAGSIVEPPLGLSFIPNSPQVWFTEGGNNFITACTVKSDGNLTACGDILDIALPYGVTFHPSRKYVYVTNSNSTTVTYCTLSDSNIPGACQQTGSGFSQPLFIAVNPSGTYAYITDNIYGTYGGAVSSCQINSNGSLSNCIANLNSALREPVSIAINPANPLIAYVTSSAANIIAACSLSSANGTILTCNEMLTGIQNPWSIAVNTTGTFAYVTSFVNNSVYYCALNSNGGFGDCKKTGTGFNYPNGIALY